MLLSPLYFMVREMTKKHLAAINRGRKAAGLKPIRMKKKKVSATEKRAVSKVAAFQENRKERVIFGVIKMLEKEIKKANKANKEIPQGVHTKLFTIRQYAKDHKRPKLESEVKRLIRLMKNP